MNLHVVVASTSEDRARRAVAQWGEKAHRILPLTIVVNDPPKGVIPAYAEGVAQALARGAELVACFHDDVELLEEDWDDRVVAHFLRHPVCGLAGFGGALGLGDSNIYQVPYNPMQLARQEFVSNMREAEAHGRRVTTPTRVACLDGFSLIGRRAFWLRERHAFASELIKLTGGEQPPDLAEQNLFQVFEAAGCVHHAYDAGLGAWAKRLGWSVWMIPVRVHHAGGQTAVADRRYHDWLTSRLSSDQLEWERSHWYVYREFADVLPIRVTEGA